MGFWIFMTISNLLIPILMIVMGKILIKNPPKRINGIYGYRTSRSRKNKEAWDFAQRYCGKLWWKTGWVMLPLSVISMLPAMGKSDDMIGGLGGAVITVECVIMVATVVFVERALTKKFERGTDK